MVNPNCSAPDCNLPGKIICDNCNQTWYCTEDHKIKNIRDHVNNCIPFKVEENESLGRYIVATRNLKPGERILQELPLLKGPAQITAPVCLGCYKLLTPETSKPCMKCGWPMCNILCQQSPDHIPECTYTVNKGTKMAINNFIFPHPSYQCLFVLRCLYQKENDPKLWEKIMKLESHCKERQGTEKYESDRVTIAQFIRKFFQLEEKFTEEEILKVCGIVQVNGHEIPLTEPPFIAIYEKCSMFEHNCKANCNKSFTSDWEVLITAGQPIAAGEHLSICYTDSLWGTQNRRHYLAQTKFFDCKCERCSDKTEFGTCFSALKCQNKECNGYLLPDTFVVETNKETDEPWKCNVCDYKLTSRAVQNILERVGQDLAAMQKGDPKSCKLFLDYYGKILHHNHYYLTDVRLALSQLLGQESEEGLTVINDEELNLKMKSCKEVIELTKTLNPAENRVRGVQLFELHAALTEYGRRKSSTGQLGPDQLAELLLESKNVLKESLELLQHEPEELPEGKIAIQAEINLSELEGLLRSITTEVGISPI